MREGLTFNTARGLNVDWARFADDWRGGDGPSMGRGRRGGVPWANIDALHPMGLHAFLGKNHITALSEARKGDPHHASTPPAPWPDAVAGCTRLRARYLLATLSNGNVALLTNMAKYAGLPWDCILSAELMKHYKPDPEVYQTAARLLGLRPEQVMMVAAHKGDLRAAQAIGLQTSFVPRPMEHGPERTADLTPDPAVTVHAAVFNDLAVKLGV